jgi:predicted nucleic acid-binding protein
MPDKAFSDSNVLLYLLSGAESKAARVETLLELDLTISVQVLNEIVNVSHRKYRQSWETINEFVSTIKALCEVVPVTERVHDQARSLAERYKFSFYDACIVSAALDSDATVLYSEDMRPELVVDRRLRIVNPFA